MRNYHLRAERLSQPLAAASGEYDRVHMAKAARMAAPFDPTVDDEPDGEDPF